MASYRVAGVFLAARLIRGVSVAKQRPLVPARPLVGLLTLAVQGQSVGLAAVAAVAVAV